VASRTHVVFLQHPREARVPVGTARMAHLSLPGSELLVGVRFEDHPRVRELLASPGTALLFPGDDSIDPRSLEAPLRTLFVVDGTWSQARKVVRENPALGRLPRIGVVPEVAGRYRIRREPAEHCMSTVEAVSVVLGAIEGDPERFRALMRPFDFMVERQLVWARHGPGRRRGSHPRVPAPLARLAARRADLVLLAAGADAHPRGSPLRGTPVLVHLAAVRPVDGAAFEAVIAPRRPLGPDTARHLGLAPERLAAGEWAGVALARFRAFLRAGDVLCGWGAFALDLLRREGESPGETGDLRAVAAARLGRAPGPPAEALPALGGAASHAAIASGRAGRMLAAMADVLEALLEIAAAPGGAGRT